MATRLVHRTVLEFTDDDGGRVTFDVLPDVDDGKIPHVWLTLEERVPGRKSPVRIQVDLGPDNARAIGQGLIDAAQDADARGNA